MTKLSKPRRRTVVAALSAALLAPLAFAAPVHAGDAEDAVAAWLAAVSDNGPAALAAVLAPEFQILRSDGTGWAREDYLGRGRSQQLKPPVPRDLFATQTGDVLVVRYTLDVEQTIDGGSITGAAPRLTVFRRDGDRWLVVAHANFAPVRH